jgi:hypothetical protein
MLTIAVKSVGNGAGSPERGTALHPPDKAAPPNFVRPLFHLRRPADNHEPVPKCGAWARPRAPDRYYVVKTWIASEEKRRTAVVSISLISLSDGKACYRTLPATCFFIARSDN